MRVIGLTGGIGSGKSYVADRLAERGAAIVDTDAIAHEISAPGGAAIPKLVEAFGPGILRADGAMDRDAMRALAFSDATAKTRLEQITHPLIREIALSRGAAAQASERPLKLSVQGGLGEGGDPGGSAGEGGGRGGGGAILPVTEKETSLDPSAAAQWRAHCAAPVSSAGHSMVVGAERKDAGMATSVATLR